MTIHHVNNYTKLMELEYVFFIILFTLIPISCLILCFFKDYNKKRKIITNFILLSNGGVFISPLLFAYISTLPNGNMWSENGSGAILWLYMLLLPLCYLIQLVLLILKIISAASLKSKILKSTC